MAIVTVLFLVFPHSPAWAQESMKVEKVAGGSKQMRQLQAGIDAGDAYPTPEGQRKLLRLPGQYVVRDKDAEKTAERVREFTGRGKRFEGYEQKQIRDSTVMLTVPEEKRGRGKPSVDAVKTELRTLRQDAGVRVDPVFVDPDSGLLRTIGNGIIVCLKKGVDAQTYFGDAWGRVRPIDGAENQFVLTLEAASAEEVLDDCVRRVAGEQVEWAEPDFESEIVQHYTPNDTYFSQQWHLKGTGAGSVQAETAWNTAKGDGIVIAIIDSGVQINHPDLQANIFNTSGYSTGYACSSGWNFYNNNANVSPVSTTESHGTCVAGVVAAAGNNNLGVTGMAFNSKILPVRIGSDADNSMASDSSKANAIRYAAGLSGGGWRGADVINMSLGFAQSSVVDSALTDAATNGRGGKGCPIFVSSGNDAADWYPYSFTISSGVHTIKFEYSKNANTSHGLDCVWLDDVTLPGVSGNYNFNSLTFPPSTWTTGGNASWTKETNVSYIYTPASVNSVRSGAITHSQSTWIQCQRNFLTSGTVSFRLLTSSESNGDVVKVYLDGVLKVTDPGGVYMSTAISYPASHASTIAVGASTDSDVKAYYSQYGTGLDFLAPSSGGSQGIYTTDRTGSAGYASGDYYNNFGGTSSASPLAAGIGALILSKNPNLTAAEVRSIMRKSCDKKGGVTYSGGDAGAGGWNTYYGYGRLNAYTALNNTPNNAVTTLQSGVAVSGISDSVSKNFKHYKISVLSGMAQLVITTSGGTGDVDLYVKHGAQPTESVYDYRPFQAGNNETVTVSNPAAGDWYIGLHAYEVYSGVTLTATYSATPPAPTGVSATTSLTDKVRVTWSAAAGATSYKVYRHTSNSSSGATLLGTVNSPTLQYDDTTTVVGTTYYYWVKASNSAGDSAFSASALGRRVLSAPATVTASQGTYTDKVAVSWLAVAGATSYKVYRHTSDSSSSATLLETVNSPTLQYDDTTAVVGTTYYYWVKASNSAGDSAFSASAQGFLGLTVTFDASPSTVTPPGKVVANGAAYGNLPDPDAFAGYAFDGWFTDPSGGTQTTPATIVTATADHTLYARWRLTLGEAVGAPGFAWTTGGDAEWFPQTQETHDGLHAVRSGAIGDDQSTWIETTVEGPGILSFWWRASSEGKADTLSCLVDGQAVRAVSGWKPAFSFWAAQTVEIAGDGPHTLRWIYEKDYCDSEGEDCAWIGEVVWTPAGEL